MKAMGKQKALVALIALLIIMSSVSENFLRIETLTDLFYNSSVYTVIALGVTLTIISAACDLSIGGMMVLAGTITIGLQPYMPTWTAALLALAAGAVIGFINGFFSVHQRTEPFIITLGMGILLKGIVLQLTNAKPISSQDLAYRDKLGNGGLQVTEGFQIPWLVLIAVVLVVLFHLLTTRTAFGRNLYAIGGDYEVAVYSGIRAMRQKWAAFVISGVMAALGGILFSARLGTASAVYGDTTALVINCSVVVGGTSFAGGVGGILPSVIGIFLLQTIETSMNLLAVGTYWQKIIEGILIVFIIGMDLRAIKRKRESV